MGDIEKYGKANSAKIQLMETLLVPGGESSKNDHSHIDLVLNAINTNSICRHSFVIVIGGGAVIDMVGYAATIAHRGVKLIRGTYYGFVTK